VTVHDHALLDYRTYWIAWLVLLVITLAMVFIGNPTVLITGMTLKATIIGLWFMHLKYERIELDVYPAFGIA
jgi:hypothetical protein